MGNDMTLLSSYDENAMFESMKGMQVFNSSHKFESY